MEYQRGYEIQASNGTVVGTYPVGTHSWGVAFDGANIWVSNDIDGTVTELRASDGTVWARFRLAAVPPAWSSTEPTSGWPTGTGTPSPSCWPAMARCRYISRGLTPQAVAFDGANIWVANLGATSLQAVTAVRCQRLLAPPD